MNLIFNPGPGSGATAARGYMHSVGSAPEGLTSIYDALPDVQCPYACLSVCSLLADGHKGRALQWMLVACR